MCSFARSYDSHICNLRSILFFKMNIMVDNRDTIFAHSYKYTIINTKNQIVIYQLPVSSGQMIPRGCNLLS